METIFNPDLHDLKASIEGDTRAFERIFRRYYGPLCDYAQGIVAAREIGEDIVQDVFLYLWSNRRVINVKVSVKAYLYSSVRHGALQYLRKQVMERAHSSRLTEFVTYLQETEYSEEELADLEKAKVLLRELPEQCRNVFLMSCLEGKRYKQIAEDLNISVNTVKTHLSKAYRIFREKLQAKDVTFLLMIAFRGGIK